MAYVDSSDDWVRVGDHFPIKERPPAPPKPKPKPKDN